MEKTVSTLKVTTANGSTDGGMFLHTASGEMLTLSAETVQLILDIAAHCNSGTANWTEFYAKERGPAAFEKTVDISIQA